MVELRHRQPGADPGRGSVGVDQSRARQHLGPLRSGDQSARDAAQGRDSGSGQRVQRHRSGRPERLAGPREVRRRLGVQRDLRRLHALDVPAGAGVESAEPGQQVPHGRAAHPGRAFRPETAADARTHFGIFAPQVWKLFPRDQVDQCELLGLQRRGPRILCRRGDRRSPEEGGGHHLEVARPDFRVADRSAFADRISAPPPRACTSFATSRRASRGTGTWSRRARARHSIS